MSLPTVLVVTLGGTITMTAAPDGTIVPTLGAEDLVRSVPGLGEVARIEAVSLMTRPGASLKPGDILEAARRIEAGLAAGAAGAVLIQGTDTIEETAFLLDLLLDGEAPVVVTGAMRGALAAGADGAANLLASVSVAATPAARGQGVLVVLNDEIHAARFVQKSHTFLPSAFQSPSAGPVGHVIEGTPRFHMQLRLRRTPQRAAPETGDFPPVALLTMVLGDDGRLLSAIPVLGYKGLVIEAMGAGHVPDWQVDALADLARHMPVILSTRVQAGPGLTRTYGFAGSETDLLRKNLISAGILSGKKARLLLMMLIAQGLDAKSITREFEAFQA
ncbi:MAG: L-asparaginase [Pelagibacterium sp. SCN 64-44]|nr:MAG: L-asparaginase [Pelagibacterium sp. SCN 64-44]